MEATATLRVGTDELDVGFITELLRTEPTDRYLKGTPISPRIPGRLRPKSIWLLKSSLDRSRRLDEHIDYVLRVLEAHSPEVEALVQRGCSIEIIAVVSSESGQAASILPSTLLRRLAGQRIDLLLDLFPPGSSFDDLDPSADGLA